MNKQLIQREQAMSCYVHARLMTGREKRNKRRPIFLSIIPALFMMLSHAYYACSIMYMCICPCLSL